VKEDGSRLVVGVDPGPRRTVQRVEIEGVEGAEKERLRDLLPLKPGDPYRLDLVAQGTRKIEADLQERGFADATVQSQTGETGVVYKVTTGPQYRLAGVDLEGEHASRPAPFLRETDLDIGKPFKQEDVEEARSRLFRTGVFSRVDAEVEKDPDGEARVTFSLAERPRFHFDYGARWESEKGTGAVVNLVDQNFLGRGITFGLRGIYEQDDRRGRLYLRTGGILGTEISLESYAEERRQTFTEDNLIEDRREAALQASRPVGRSDTARVYARYRTTHLFEIDPNPFIPFDSETRLPYLGVQLLRDTRDDPIDPGRGLFASLDLSGTGTFLGSDFQFLRLFAQASSFRALSLAGRPWTWAQSVRLGLAHPFAGQELVPSERFRAGGPYSVRGYEMESLGPREVLGDIVNRAAGGEALFIVNEEIRVPLPWDLTGLAFFDAGQVWAKPGDADFDLAKSLGLGLRARTPLGLLRFDAAYPLDRRPGEPSYKLYVGFGNAF
jgi:outer membrane protein assembly factor BamA